MLPLLAAMLAGGSAVLAQPPGPEKWEPMAELTDEFDGGALDTEKWHPTNPEWRGRPPGLFLQDNVTVSDGKLHITMRREDREGSPEGYHTFTCGAVRSKVKVRYGYFEAKCRAMKSRGSSSFWFYDHTPEVWPEIDVFEIGGAVPGHERIVHMNAHMFHDPTFSKGHDYEAQANLADDFHVYALKWTSKEMVYYLDGHVVHTVENTDWHQPLYMNFDSQTMPEWFGLPDEKDLPSTFSIEYVRAWRLVE